MLDDLVAFTPVLIVGIVFYYRYKVNLLKFGSDRQQLAELRQTHQQLEARVQNLEGIVCSLEDDLDKRMRQLTAGAASLPK